MKHAVCLALAFTVCGLTVNAFAQPDFDTIQVVSGLNQPVFVTSPPDDFDRLFIVELDGVIRIFENGALLPTPFLDITGLITNPRAGEQGLFCMAFHPDYASNGFFFIHYTGANGDSILARYTVSGDPDVADPGSAVIFLTEPQPFTNHNGGMITFKPDDPNNYLYAAIGDGGSGGDPQENAEDINSRKGKILRIDVDAGAPAQAPPSNPFVGQAGDDLIWAYGLRNPWRFSFDRKTGDMYIGDVGQDAVEEIDFEPSDSPGGANYGWDLLEGSEDFECVDCDAVRAATVLPIHEYMQGPGGAFGDFRSVTGGYVHRGLSSSKLHGRYFFADLNGFVSSFRFNGSSVSSFVEHGADILAPGSAIVSFGEDAAGELYIVDINGQIFKIVDPNATLEATISRGAAQPVEGERFELRAAIFGVTPPLDFQWVKDGSDLAVDASIADVTSQSLVFDPLRPSDSGSYRLRFSDDGDAAKAGPFLTDPFELTVIPAGALPVGRIAAAAILGSLALVAAAVLLRRRRA